MFELPFRGAPIRHPKSWRLSGAGRQILRERMRRSADSFYAEFGELHWLLRKTLFYGLRSRNVAREILRAATNHGDPDDRYAVPDETAPA